MRRSTYSKFPIIPISFAMCVTACSSPPDGRTSSTAERAGAGRSSPPTAQSEPTAKVAAADTALDKILPPDLKAFAGVASQALGAYAGVTQAINVIETVGTVLGFLDSQPTPLDQAVKEIISAVDAIGNALSWQMNQQDRQQRLATMHATLDYLGMLRTQGLPVSTTSDGVYESQQAVYDAEEFGTGNTSFLRLYDPAIYYKVGLPRSPELCCAGGDGTDWAWTYGLLNSPLYDPAQKHQRSDFVYDWRVGVPELMQLINLRLQIIAEADPNWRTDGAFTNELLRHYNALNSHLVQMYEGVECNTYFSPADEITYSNDTYFVVCGDIYTGAAIGGESYWPPSNGDTSVDSDRLLWLQPLQEQYRNQLRAAMPFDEMNAMLTSLWNYAYGA